MNNKQKIRVNVVAHNEAGFIEQCLDSIKIALEYASQQNAEVSIITNGCSDSTYDIAKTYSEKLNNWNTYNLELGDKANAWNYAIKLVDNSQPFSIFVDGDCSISAQAIKALLQTYNENPNSYIIAGIPGTRGNTTEDTIQKTLNGNALSGNFYAATPNFIKKIKDNKFLLPVGLIGDDSLLAWVSSHDFKLSNGVIPGFLVGSKEAEFYYHRLTPDSLQNIKLYIRRIHRYSLRHLQQSCIREFLDIHNNFNKIPKETSELYHYIKIKHIRMKSIYSLFDLYNYIRLK